jgi:hypothetical protein
VSKMSETPDPICYSARVAGDTDIDECRVPNGHFGTGCNRKVMRSPYDVSASSGAQAFFKASRD